MLGVCRCRPWCIFFSVLGSVVIGALVVVLVLQPWNGSEEPRRYPRAVVAANGHECASIGRSILEREGSAVDAAIATLFCEGVSCAQCTGLGGGFLATIYDASTGQMRSLNSRERAPMAATPDMYENASPTVGGKAVAVPGELRGLGELYRQYGKLPWAELIKPTADMCRKGHLVTAYMARTLQSNRETILAEPSMREQYVDRKTNDVYKAGDYITEPTLARTLDIIAAEGPEAIHNGSLTSALVRDIQSFGGIITEDDLRNFRAVWQDPIAVPLTGGHHLYSVPLPGSGSVLAFILNVLQGWVGAGTQVPYGSEIYWQRIVETFKYAYAKRTGLGDPTRSDLPYNLSELERNLSSPSWAYSYRHLINDSHTSNDWRDYGALFEGAEDHGTAHIAVIGPDGSAVSVTGTINYIWGAKIRSTSLGIMLNNEMDDFAIPNRHSSYGMPPSPANLVAPGLQPLSSMVPAIVLSPDGDVKLVVGAAGGTKITTQVALATLNIITEQMRIDEAMNKYRLHHQLLPMEVQYEENFDEKIIESLKRKGHTVTSISPTLGFAALIAAVRNPDGSFSAQTDHRRGGSVDGL